MGHEKAGDTVYCVFGLAAAGNILALWKLTGRGVDNHSKHTHTGTITLSLSYRLSIALLQI